MRQRRRALFLLLQSIVLIASALLPSIAAAGDEPSPIPPPPPPPAPGVPYPFTDIESSAFQIQIAWLYNTDITGGCTATKFCPTSNVTRAQMASFLVRALGLPATSRDFFNDDNASAHEGDINRLAAARITGGCAARRFCRIRRSTASRWPASSLARSSSRPPRATTSETTMPRSTSRTSTAWRHQASPGAARAVATVHRPRSSASRWRPSCSVPWRSTFPVSPMTVPIVRSCDSELPRPAEASARASILAARGDPSVRSSCAARGADVRGVPLQRAIEPMG